MYNKNIGRSLCRRRPVSMPVSAGLYAGIGRSLCRRRPVSMPASAGLYAGMGPRGLGPNPFSTVSPCPPGFFFREKQRPKK